MLLSHNRVGRTVCEPAHILASLDPEITARVEGERRGSGDKRKEEEEEEGEEEETTDFEWMSRCSISARVSSY